MDDFTLLSSQKYLFGYEPGLRNAILSPLVTAFSPPALLNSLTAMSAPSAKLTCTPRVEEHDDVPAAAVSCRRLVLDGATGHRQPVQATHGAGRRADRQLHLVAALLRDLGRPAFVLRRVHKQNGGVGAFGHGGQGTYATQEVRQVKHTRSTIQRLLNTTY